MNRLPKRILSILTIGGMAGVFLIPLNPVNSKMLNITLLAAFGAAWLGAGILVWNHRSLRIAHMLTSILLVTPFLLPSRPFDHDALRADYVRRMSGFEGTKYVWGGENSRGIDCSGLPRRALRDALLANGIRHLDGGSFRIFLEQWWFDASAKAMARGYRNHTRPLSPAGTIASMDYSALKPGDLAVTTSGVHMLAYVGGGKWIQADPGAGKVITLDGRKSGNAWFAVPVTTHRWSVSPPQQQDDRPVSPSSARSPARGIDNS